MLIEFWYLTGVRWRGRYWVREVFMACIQETGEGKRRRFIVNYRDEDSQTGRRKNSVLLMMLRNCCISWRCPRWTGERQTMRKP